MKIIPVGTGSAFTMKNWQSNFIIEQGEKRLLIDAGGDIRWGLKDLGLNYKSFDAIYLTHQHADHVGGMEYFGFCSYFDPSCPKIRLFGHKKVLKDAWSDSLRGGLRSIQGKCVELEDYFDIVALEDNGMFLWQNVQFNLVQSIHIMDGYSMVPSFGLMIKPYENVRTIYFTSDSQFAPHQIQTFYDQADVIIQDCETAPFKSGVHAHYDQLKTLNDKTKNKMYLFHFQDNVIDAWDECTKKAQAEGFRGFLKKGEEVKC